MNEIKIQVSSLGLQHENRKNLMNLWLKPLRFGQPHRCLKISWWKLKEKFPRWPQDSPCQKIWEKFPKVSTQLIYPLQKM